MKTQPLNNVYSGKQYSKNNKTNIVKKNNISFSSYQEAMLRAVYKDFKASKEVSNEFSNLYQELLNTVGVEISPAFDLLNNWLTNMPIALIKELCKPLGEIKPELRNLIIDTEKDSITILEKSDHSQLTLYNYGKQGFLNTLFNNQNARNDMRLGFFSDNKYLELSMKKDQSIVLEQGRSGISEYSYFNRYTGEKEKTKSTEFISYIG